MSRPYEGILDLPYEVQAAIFEQVLAERNHADMTALAQESLYFFLVGILGRTDAMHPWICDRAKEVQLDPDGRLDLWARFHYKSTLVTFALTLWELAQDPELTFGIFSHTKGIARGFLGQLKKEMEDNPLLHWLWPDVFHVNPLKGKHKWGIDVGLCVKRKGNPKEQSIEAWGLTDGQPTSKHYQRLIYDDIVTLESVNTPEQIEKTTSALEISYMLGTDGGKIRYVGTRYHPQDTYHTLIERGSAVVRCYPATDDGTISGRPVLVSFEYLDEKKRDMTARNFGAQMLLNPISSDTKTFDDDWLAYYSREPDPEKMNMWILVDPASGKNKRRNDLDYTVFWVWGLGVDNNYYMMQGCVRRRLKLTERADILFSLKRRYPRAQVGYEEYGLQADIEHMKDRMEREQYRFNIIPVGGAVQKMQRIERLEPLFKNGRVWLPNRCMYAGDAGRICDFVQEFVDDEYKVSPVLVHDDMLDAASRIFDVPALFPKHEAPEHRRGHDPRRAVSKFDAKNRRGRR